MSPHKTNSHGFTLLEILLVVGIIAILAGIVIVAINPARQLAQARNTERRSDIKQIKSAMEQFYIDKGYYPASTTLSATTTLLEVCDTGASSSPTGITCTGKLNLSELVPVYITAIPKDPQATTTYSAGYKVVKDATNKLVMTAPQAELSVFIAIGTSTPSAYNGTLGNGLIIHYKMNDTSGTAIINNINPGTYNAVAQRDASLLTVSGAFGAGTAINFAAASADYLTTASIPDLSTFSVATWIYINSIPKDWLPIFFLGTGSCEFVLYDWSNPPKLSFASWALSEAANTTATVPLSGWHHVVLVRTSGSNPKFYIDGAEKDITLNAGPTAGSYGVQNLTIGKQPGTGRYINAAMDDYRIYNRALTPTEITELAAGTEAE